MKPATVDLLDAQLSAEYQRYGAMKAADHFAIYSTANIILSPHLWTKYGPEVDKLCAKLGVAWSEVPYKGLRDHIANKLKSTSDVGIYMFVARATAPLNGLPALVFYVGVGGITKSRRPLWKRLLEYLDAGHVRKRDRVEQALMLYYEHAYVWYSLLKASIDELTQLETALHGLYHPWASPQALPVTVKKGRRAWG